MRSARPGTVAIVRRAEDPTGGPPWALRRWESHIDARSMPSGSGGRDLLCFAFGMERGDRLVLPLAGGATRTVGAGGADARCNEPDRLHTHTGGADVRTYVEDPDAPDPKPVRIVVAGLLGDGVRSARLLGAGPARMLELGRDGTFLMVLGPEHAGEPLRVRQVRDDGSGGARSPSTQAVVSRYPAGRCASPTRAADSRGRAATGRRPAATRRSPGAGRRATTSVASSVGGSGP